MCYSEILLYKNIKNLIRALSVGKVRGSLKMEYCRSILGVQFEYCKSIVGGKYEHYVYNSIKKLSFLYKIFKINLLSFNI